MSNHGKIWWNELNTWQPENALKYYGEVMGWEFDEVPTAGTDEPRSYYIAKKNGEPVAGIFTLHGAAFKGVPEHWFTYLAVDDIEAAIASSDANGGKVMREPFEIPGVGTMSVIGDRNGAVMAFIEPTSNEQAP